ncbi:MAG TPA: diaminopropionate ammonia-lyase [Steroidobacter sp.]|nr:diaminopropionate ammonia-lyase [Steroidobacter sp.]
MSVIGIHKNQRAPHRGKYAFHSVLSLEGAARAYADISACPIYQRTPLVKLDGIARRARVGRVFYKDESSRFGLGSFKALGGAYAVARVLCDRLRQVLEKDITIADLARGVYREHTNQVTVTCATDGNHGRAVAAGARVFGCRCVVFLHAGVSAERERAIASYGAQIVRVQGSYDDSVRAAQRAADAEGWTVVSDTSWPGYEAIPSIVMQGYTVMLREILEQLRESGEAAPTHVFVQAGVGGLAAAVVAHLWEELGAAAPIFVIVEPERAACLFASAEAGRPTAVHGELDTIMAGLACGEVSEVAWRILAAASDYFVTINEESAVEGMRLLAAGENGDPNIVAGESATAGLAALLAIAEDPRHERLRQEMRLDQHARVLLFGTEGATDPELYQRLVGKPAQNPLPELPT